MADPITAPIVENPQEYDPYLSRISIFLTNYNVMNSNIAPFALRLSGSGQNRYYDNYEFIFGGTTPSMRDRITFSIIRVKSRDSLGQAIDEYYSFEDNEVKLENSRIIYNPEEQSIINNLYGDVEPELQISLNPPTLTNNIQQNSVPTPQFFLGFMSSLGEISQESITVSAVTGSVTGLITEQTETVTDVGGLSGAGRDRTIVSTDVTVGSTSTRNVTTSGY